jgi:hypothetical protein
MMTNPRILFAVVLVLLGVGRLCAADATFTVVLTDYQVERDKMLVEAFDLTLNSTKDTAGPLVRPSKTNRTHDNDKATLTIETQYRGVPEGEYEVWYWIPSLESKTKPYMEKFQLLPNGHFRKTLEFSTREVVLKYGVSKDVMALLPKDRGSRITISKVKERSEMNFRTLEYRSGGRLKNGVADKAEITLWLIPDGEYLAEFDPTWGYPIEVPFRVVDGKTTPEVITFSEENRVRSGERQGKPK